MISSSSSSRLVLRGGRILVCFEYYRAKQLEQFVGRSVGVVFGEDQSVQAVLPDGELISLEKLSLEKLLEHHSNARSANGVSAQSFAAPESFKDAVPKTGVRLLEKKRDSQKRLAIGFGLVGQIFNRCFEFKNAIFKSLRRHISSYGRR